MQKGYIVKILLFFVVAFTSVGVQAKDPQNEHGTTSKESLRIDTKNEVKEYINHHLQDSYDFNLYSDSEEGTHVGFPLPVILIDDGLKVFLSSKFHHGETVAEVDGNFYKIDHGRIYKTNAAGDINYDDDHHPTNEKPLDFSITKNVFTILLTSILLLLLFGSLARNYRTRNIPKGFGRVLEPLVLYVRDEIAIPNIGVSKYRKFMGFLLTVFFFVWILNLLGMTPLGVNVTGNIAITACLALFTYLITQFSGTKDYWKHIFWMPGVPVIMKIILIPIELLGTLTKPFALMVRLFANITAGHVVIMSLIALIFVTDNIILEGPISVLLTLFISVIELLVAFLQAYIFTMLSALFIGLAVEEHDHEHEHSESNEIV
jgi:F-type H+-transporting ATPase subunit a